MSVIKPGRPFVLKAAFETSWFTARSGLKAGKLRNSG